jgi:hypothetical protein
LKGKVAIDNTCSNSITGEETMDIFAEAFGKAGNALSRGS